jgi:hypothetical protein
MEKGHHVSSQAGGGQFLGKKMTTIHVQDSHSPFNVIAEAGSIGERQEAVVHAPQHQGGNAPNLTLVASMAGATLSPPPGAQAAPHLLEEGPQPLFTTILC